MLMSIHKWTRACKEGVKAVMWCPECNGDIEMDHVIDRWGNVMPRVCCMRCGWNGFVRLEGWDKETR